MIRRPNNFAIGVLLCLAMTPLLEAAPILAEFEGQPPETSFAVPEYIEGGFYFRDPGGVPVATPYHVGRTGGRIPFFPENGSAYLQFLSGDSLVIGRLDARPFQLLSLELAEYSTVFPVPRNIQVIGVRADGSQAAIVLTLDGIIDGTGPLRDFETFSFGTSFSNLVEVRIPTDLFSIDNILLDVTPVPEPGNALLVALGMSLLAGAPLRQTTR